MGLLGHYEILFFFFLPSSPKSGVLGHERGPCEDRLLYVMIAVHMHNISDEEQAFVFSVWTHC